MMRYIPRWRGRKEKGERRREKGEGRREKGEGRSPTGTLLY